MTFSARFTEIRPTSQYSARTQSPRCFVLHGAAMTSLDGLSNMIVNGTRQVSAHGGFKDARGIGWVNEEYRAWSLSDARWDSLAYTLENANESTDGYTFSGTTQESIAQWIADVSRRTGIYPHRNGDPTTWTVIGHSEVYTIHEGSYATACPQSLDLNWITARAQQILKGATKRKKSDVPDLLRSTLPDTDTVPEFILTDYRYREVIPNTAENKARLMAIQQSMFGATLNGVDRAAVTRVLSADRYATLRALPNFPTGGSGGGGTDLTPILTAVMDGFKALPDAILTRFRAFWSTGK